MATSEWKWGSFFLSAHLRAILLLSSPTKNRRNHRAVVSVHPAALVSQSQWLALGLCHIAAQGSVIWC